MQIKVEANDMYNVLTLHGIDVTEAKAIILDLLLKAEGTVLGDSVKEPENEFIETESAMQDSAYETQEVSSVEEDSVGKISQREEKGKIRRKRLNFGAFGGPADSLT